MKTTTTILFTILLFAACSKKDDLTSSVLSNNNQSQASAVADVELTYTAAGNEAVDVVIIKNLNGKKLYKIYYPSALEGPYPLITWGNGTGATANNYDSVLAHLASWGFVVIDNYVTQTGTGESILQSAKYMAKQNSKPGSKFFNQIDLAHIGAAGHSQGATGVINAQTKFTEGSDIKTIVPIALPSLSLTDNAIKYDASKITCPVFFITGTKDPLISPFSVNKNAYDKLVAGLPAAMAMRIGADHNAIQTNTMDWGYLTAWMCYYLKNDANAKPAFALPDAEILTNANWKNAAVKNIE